MMMSKDDYLKDPVFQAIQHLARAAFEKGWIAAGGNPVSSPYNKPAVGWRAAWLESEERKILVENGVITGEGQWR